MFIERTIITIYSNIHSNGFFVISLFRNFLDFIFITKKNMDDHHLEKENNFYKNHNLEEEKKN